MQHIELEVDISAPAELVWSLITNWPKQSDWMMATTVAGDGDAVGGKISAFTGFGPIGFLDTMQITLWNPPLRCDVIHTGKVVRGTGSFQVEHVDVDRSKFIWIEDLDIPFGLFGLFGFKILRPFFVAGVKTSLNKFAKQASDISK